LTEHEVSGIERFKKKNHFFVKKEKKEKIGFGDP
jgi:hypothetical protein